MTKTTNYQLNQWAKPDRVMMDDFNADNAKIDAALKANADAIVQKGVLTKLKEYTFNGSSADLNSQLSLDVHDIDWNAWQAVIIDTELYGTLNTDATLSPNCGGSSISIGSSQSNDYFAKADVKKAGNRPELARTIFVTMGSSANPVRGISFGKPYLMYGYSSSDYTSFVRFNATAKSGFFDTGSKFTVYGVK